MAVDATLPKPSRKHPRLLKQSAAIVERAEAFDDDDELMNTADLARFLDVSIQWVCIGRNKGYGPKFIRVGVNRVRYRKKDVIAWLNSLPAENPGE